MSKDWYARKLGGGTPRRDPVTLPAQQPQPGLPQQPAPYPAQQPGDTTGSRTPYEAAFRAGDAAGGHQTQALREKLAHDRCPQCGSPDYLGVSNTAPHCFACGYNGGRFSHELG